MDLGKMTIDELKEVRALLGGGRATREATPLPFRVGDKLLIRTVTMIQLGVVTAIGRDFLVMNDGGWLADTGRFNECLASGKVGEFERAPSWFMVGRGAIVDVYPWDHEIPKKSQ